MIEIFSNLVGIMSLKKLKSFVYFFHKEQKDKNNKPYLFHLFSVLKITEKRMVQNNQFSIKDIENAKIVSLLHNILEDTSCTIEDLKKYPISEENIYSISVRYFVNKY